MSIGGSFIHVYSLVLKVYIQILWRKTTCMYTKKRVIASTHALRMLNMQINWREFYPRLQSLVKYIYTESGEGD